MERIRFRRQRLLPLSFRDDIDVVLSRVGIDTIRAVHIGQMRIPPSIATKLAERVTGGPELTTRERRVLELIVAGQSNKEIAAALSITEGTVKAHVNSLLDKLGVADRTQAVTTRSSAGSSTRHQVYPRRLS